MHAGRLFWDYAIKCNGWQTRGTNEREPTGIISEAREQAAPSQTTPVFWYKLPGALVICIVGEGREGRRVSQALDCPRHVQRQGGVCVHVQASD